MNTKTTDGSNRANRGIHREQTALTRAPKRS